MDKVLLVGGFGFLGSAIERILSKEYDVHVVSRRTGVSVDNYSSLLSVGCGFSAIVNCSGIIDCKSGAVSDSLKINTVGAYNVARYAAEKNLYLMHISSISAIKAKTNQYYNSYAISKSAGDDLVEHFCKENSVPFSLLRFSQLYDFDGYAEKTQAMLYRLIRQLLDDGVAILYGKRNPIRNFLHVDDAATMVKNSLDMKKLGKWNCIHPDSVRIYELIEIIADILKIDARITIMPREKDLLSIYIPNKRLLHQELPDFYPLTIENGVREIVKRYTQI